ncbi:MAG: PDZ domain-containing protein [Clostridia bacterium]|nr:PDZ domain-containing protein [Clostridia bacterium]
MKNSSKILLSVIITFFVTSIIVSSLHMYVLNDESGIDYSRLKKVEKIIEDNYINTYDKKAAEDAAVRALISTTGDKYAAYYDEESANKLFGMIDGYYCGIGVEVFANPETNNIEIISALPGAPAEKAGIKGGDIIISIDSKKYNATQIADATAYLRCREEELKEKGSVVIKVKRENELIDIKVDRAKIDYYSVSSSINENILYVRYTGFSEKAYKEFEKIIKENNSQNIKGIIIDLRDNPGGEFNSAIRMCDLFLSDGQIMYTLDKDNNKKVYTADKYSFNAPMVVLVNKQSASAAEIFAGSMKGRNRAVIIGEKTFGKGVSQSIVELNRYDKSEGAVKITSKKNYAPDGKWLSDGVVPDIVVDEDPDYKNIEKDFCYIEAIKYLKANNSVED